MSDLALFSLEELKRKRGAIKAKVTNFGKYLSALKTTTDNISDENVLELQDRLDHAKKIIGEFENVQDLIEEKTTDENLLENEYKERDTFDSNFYSQIASAKNLIKKSTLPSGNNSSSNETNTLKLAGIKLKPIEIPKFNGSYQNWLEFADLFESLVHKNESLDDIQKFHYLRSSLEAGAAQVIRSIDFTTNNYAVAWNLIRERYDNKRLLVFNHVKSLFNIEPIQRESSYKLRNLIDTYSKHLHSLKQMGQQTDHWDVLLIHIITTKLDSSSLREWENAKSNDNKEVPTFNDLKTFLKSRADLLETLEINQADKRAHHSSNTNSRGTFNHTRGYHASHHPSNYSNNHHTSNHNKPSSTSTQRPICPICKNSHIIYHCTEFMSLSSSKKLERAKNAQLCLNCLKTGHNNKNCRHTTCCKTCEGRHHTLLHINYQGANLPREVTSHSTLTPIEPSTSVTNCSFSNVPAPTQVILSTALINVYDQYNNIHTARALLDSGSQSSFISKEFYNKLGLSADEVNWKVSGITNISCKLDKLCSLKITSKINNFQAQLQCFIVPQISGSIPAIPLNIQQLNIPKHLPLADHMFHKPQQTDILIGSDLFWSLLCKNTFNLGKNKPIMHQTVFGWVIAGPYSTLSARNIVNCNFLTSSDEAQIQNQLARFWEIEEIVDKPIFSKEETVCEQHFYKNTRRDTSGKFIVALPFKESTEKLGDSYNIARKRFFNLERKLRSNSKIKQLYTDFIHEYINLGHMKNITDFDPFNASRNNFYFMPHHSVLKETSLTTRLRVVFDCSAATSSGFSLNDLQMAGPTLQDDLLAILLRFRMHTYVVSADIEKMYRQILVHEDQQSLQCILWRDSPSEPLKVFQINRVTYGMKCSSYLAIKCLHTLGSDYSKTDLKISNIILSDFYVDDLLTGFDSIEEAQEACHKIIDVLKQGGFPLRKFYSNEPIILKNICDGSSTSTILSFGENENCKTLGLSWSPYNDLLLYSISPLTLFKEDEKITKRRILSDISQVFDPLGLLTPCIISFKIILQNLWLEQISWDDPVPLHIRTLYINLRQRLPNLNNLKIERLVKSHNYTHIELHGFADASEKAYGGCIYIVSTDKTNKTYSHLLCAKSKVAPLKPITIPRLELCGALLLSRLAKKVINSVKINFNNCFLWTDSSIVLCWLKKPANELKTFVSNRVNEIQESISFAQWRHVPTADNPADLLSRGVPPENLSGLNLWWHGPKWVTESRDNWPVFEVAPPEEIPDIKKQISSFVTHTDTSLFLFQNFSNLLRLKRSAAYVLRFTKNSRVKALRRNLGPLSSDEINQAFIFVLKDAQNETFKDEIQKLSNNIPLKKSCKINNLSPFVDKEGILRVGGRLQNSQFSYDKKHPIILSSNHQLTRLIFHYSHHQKLFHAGPQLLLANIRENYWPIGGRDLARRTVHNCIACFRAKPKGIQPIMGNLPAQRLLPGPPFIVSGVDYAGPYLIRDRKGRGPKLIKSYICIFVCFSTKAVHIELVTDLSKDTFLLALKRFMARRGKPRQIFSDNGKNFVSASTDFKELRSFLTSNESTIINSLSKDEVEWKFSPPYAPHFGGLWEAGVKLIKHHIKRVLLNTHLTYEEFYSLLTQIEAIINSRPLTPLSTDPNDYTALTPGHFLIGRPVTATIDEQFINTPINRLTRYQLTQKLSQHMWERWNKEYISELQKRTKWVSSQGDTVTENRLVVIKEDNLPPMRWKLGRVSEVVCGRDGVARVFKIKTSSGVITRSFSKICPLPINDDIDN